MTSKYLTMETSWMFTPSIIKHPEEPLKMSRMNRVLPEPALQEPHVIVSVRHPTFGVVRRAFPPNCTVMALYDWVGSLSTRPEHFALCFSSPYRIVYP